MHAKPFLTRLASQGKPLVEVHLTAFSEAGKQAVMELVNAIADDIYCAQGPYRSEAIYIQGTGESLGWLLGCRFHRVLVNPAVNQEYHKWGIIGNIRLPLPLVAYVRSIDGLSQPGYDDDGQLDSVTYEAPPRRPL